MTQIVHSRILIKQTKDNINLSCFAGFYFVNDAYIIFDISRQFVYISSCS